MVRLTRGVLINARDTRGGRVFHPPFDRTNPLEIQGLPCGGSRARETIRSRKVEEDHKGPSASVPTGEILRELLKSPKLNYVWYNKFLVKCWKSGRNGVCLLRGSRVNWFENLRALACLASGPAARAYTHAHARTHVSIIHFNEFYQFSLRDHALCSLCPLCRTFNPTPPLPLRIQFPSTVSSDCCTK